MHLLTLWALAEVVILPVGAGPVIAAIFPLECCTRALPMRGGGGACQQLLERFLAPGLTPGTALQPTTGDCSRKSKGTHGISCRVPEHSFP